MATTTNYSWATPDDSDPFKQGASAIRSLGSSVDSTLYTALGGSYPGLRLVKKQTIGSAVSSVVVSDAFSATYDNYRILINGGVGSVGNGILRLQLGSVGAGNYFSNFIYAGYAGGAVSSVANNGGANINYAGISDTINISAEIEVMSPFLTKQKLITATYYDSASTGRTQGQCADQNSQTAFTIIATTGTLTGGTIYVYGYGKS